MIALPSESLHLISSLLIRELQVFCWVKEPSTVRNFLPIK